MYEVRLVQPNLEAIQAAVDAAPMSGWEIDFEHDAFTEDGRTWNVYFVANSECSPEITFRARRYIDSGELAEPVSVLFSLLDSNGEILKEETVKIDGLEDIMTAVEAKMQFRQGVRDRIERQGPDGWTDDDFRALGMSFPINKT